MDINTIHKFINFISSGYSEKEKIFWEVRLLNKNGEIKAQLFFDSVGKLKEYFSNNCEELKNYNCYISILPRVEMLGTSEAVKFGNVIVIDLDSELAMIKHKEIYQKLCNLGIKPSLMVASGKGLHVYYKLKEVVDVEKWKELQERSIHLFKENFEEFYPDEHVKDPARVMRIIGTLNLKYKKPLETIIIKEGEPLSVSDLDKILPQTKVLKELVTNTNLVFNEHLTDEQIEKLVKLLSPIWKVGVRHKLNISLLGLALKSGISRESMKKLFQGICEATRDEEIRHRLYEVDYHYNNVLNRKSMQELKGITGIKEVLEKVLEDENKARELCLNLLQIIPKTKEEMEKEIGNVIDFPDLNLTLLLDFPHKIVVAISPNVTVSIKRKYSDENWWLGPKTFKGFIKELQTLHALPQNIQNEKVEEIRMKIDEKYKEWHTKLSKTDEVESSQEKEPELTQKENEVLRQLENGKLLPVTILRKTLDKKIVGEEINKQVLFFAALSAKLKNFRERLHCRLTGPSAAGKTYLITRVLDCFPPSMKIEVGGMTPKAWVYAAARTGFMDFHGKILVCLVEPPREFYDLINSVLTGDKEKFKWLYTNKIEGALTTSEIIIFGVPSYITASVKLPQEELATRILQLSPDLTREQTDRIMRSQSEEEYEVDEEDCNHEKILQEYIENIPICDVVVPFCDVVRGVFPKEVRMRRDFPKLKTLVKSITLFNYYLRPKIVIGDSVIVLSTLSDFALGLYLFSQAFEATFSGIPNYLQSFLSRLNEQFSSNSFSTAEAIQVFRDFAPNTVRAYLRQLEELNFLESSTVAGQKYYTILVSRGSNIIIDGFSFSKVKDVREKLLRKLNGAEVEYFGKKISPATIIEKLYGDEAIKKFIKRWEKLNKPKEQVCIETLATFLEKDMQIPTTLQPQTTRGGDEWL